MIVKLPTASILNPRSAILMVLIAYGLPSGKAAGLRLDDLNWEEETLRVRCPSPGRTHHRDVQSTARYAHLARTSVKAAGERVSESLLRIRTRLRTVPCRTIRAGMRRSRARRARAHGQEEALSGHSLVTAGWAGGRVVTCFA